MLTVMAIHFAAVSGRYKMSAHAKGLKSSESPAPLWAQGLGWEINSTIGNHLESAQLLLPISHRDWLETRLIRNNAATDLMIGHPIDDP